MNFLFTNCILFFFFILFSCENDTNEGKMIYDTIKFEIIKRVDKLHQDDSCYLAMPNCIVFHENRIFGVDLKKNIAFRVNKSLDSALTFASQGKGPGELVDPNIIRLKNGIVFIGDNAHKIQKFDIDGNYLGEIPINFLPGSEFDVNSQGHIFVPNNNPQDENIISEYDENGNLKKKFGEFKDQSGFGNIFLLNQHLKLSIDNNDDIYVAFSGLPFIRKYNKNYELVWEVDLTSLGEIKEKVDNIRKKVADNKVGHSTIMWLFNSMVVDDFVYLIFSGKYDKSFCIGLDKKNGKIAKRVIIEDNKTEDEIYCNTFQIDNEGNMYLLDLYKSEIILAKRIPNY